MTTALVLAEQPRPPLAADDFAKLGFLLPLRVTLHRIGHGIGLFDPLPVSDGRLQPVRGGVAIYTYRLGEFERFGDPEIALLAERCACADKARIIRERRHRGAAQELALKVSMSLALARMFEERSRGLELRPKPGTRIPHSTLHRKLRHGEDMAALWVELLEALPGWAQTVAQTEAEHEALIERIIASGKAVA